MCFGLISQGLGWGSFGFGRGGGGEARWGLGHNGWGFRGRNWDLEVSPPAQVAAKNPSGCCW